MTQPPTELYISPPSPPRIWKVELFGKEPGLVTVTLIERPHWWKRWWLWAFFGWRFVRVPGDTTP